MAESERAWWRDPGVVLAVAAAVVWAVQWSHGRPLFIDEQYLALNVRERGLLGLAGDLDHNQSAPLGWLWVQWGITHVLGTGDRVLRLLPFAFGLLTLAAAAVIGRRWLGAAGGAALVLLCAVNPVLLYHATEFKQYSADAAAVLVLVGLAAWVVERPSARAEWVWWGVAAVAGWFSMASVLVTPGLALTVLLVRRRSGWLRWCLKGFVWLASFALHYALSLRHAAGDDFLVTWFDGIGFPKQADGLGGVRAWLADRPEALVQDPFGLDAGLALPVCLLVVAGIALAAWHRPAFGALLAVPILSGFALAVARVAPLSDRLALWLVPVAYLATAVVVAAAARGLRAVWRRRRWAALLAAVPAAALLVGAVVAVTPLAGRVVRPLPTTDQVDDREAVAYLARERRPDDLIMVFLPSVYAVDWYAPQLSGVVHTFDVVAPGPDCDLGDLKARAAGHGRIIAYLGHRTGPVPVRSVLGARLGELGAVQPTVLGDGAGGPGTGWVYVADLTQPGKPAPASAPYLTDQPKTCLKLA
ncbi:glycosyltransferase family 39 protein [Dactylosporangium sucinum]|uniref:Glycosyltransferase RgtA/B/C/D-like domain-containing protein n=1 Tax=Dactylosporangium sucinum TaxID=1424081 RepID=A0A917WMI5_9ACTN|nr:glycosyltransferase family 39 protein [Dactylosporangium sucinum]GGM16547.1 hypothetical protein GCM10007977_017300 [Dactylosporangium sucinum]